MNLISIHMLILKQIIQYLIESNNLKIRYELSNENFVDKKTKN